MSYVARVTIVRCPITAAEMEVPIRAILTDVDHQQPGNRYAFICTECGDLHDRPATPNGVDLLRSALRADRPYLLADDEIRRRTTPKRK